MKNIFKFALASVVVAFVGFGVYQNMPQENTLSDFALENIEALTIDEYTQILIRECNYHDGEVCTIIYQGLEWDNTNMIEKEN